MQDLIGYDEIIENSMRSVIYETLKKIEKSGLPGKHYFIMTFLVDFPGVVVPKGLKEKYSEEITIVIQHQYKGLAVEHDFFKISLSFAGKYEKLVVPYKAVTSFADPYMNFGLKFSVSYDDSENLDEESDSKQVNKNESKKKSKTNLDLSAKVVSLDAFRKTKNNDNNE